MIIVIDEAQYEAEPKVVDYVHSLESEIAQLKAENAYHIAKIKSMHKDIENAARGPVYNFDSDGYAVMMPKEHYAQTVTKLHEAKQLLKAAVDDIHELLCDRKNLEGSGQGCSTCSYIDKCSCCRECLINEDLRNWRYADKALKLIGDA